MKRPIVIVPRDFLRAYDFTWDIDWRGQSAGDSTAGIAQVVVNAFPRWIGRPRIHLDRAAILAWRAMRWQAGGLAGIYLVEMADPLVPLPASALDATGLSFAGGARFANGLGWAYLRGYRVSATASRGATAVRVQVMDDSPHPRPGQILSFDHWPVAVTEVEALDAVRYEITVAPPLRCEVPAGERLALRPTGLFEAAEAGMGAPDFGFSQRSTPTLAFREVLNR